MYCTVWQSMVKWIYIMEKITSMLIPEIAQLTDRWSPWREAVQPDTLGKLSSLHILKAAGRWRFGDLWLIMQIVFVCLFSSIILGCG